MKVLITSATSELAQYLANTLGANYSLRVTDRWQGTGTHPFVRSPLDHDSSTNLLVRDMDAIVHVGVRADKDTDRSYLDYLTRCTYNLLHAAVEENVKRVVFLSTLALFEPYDEAYIVTERWRPRPSTDPRILSTYLGECVCREFAREHKVEVVVLRIGEVVDPAMAGLPKSINTWLSREDLGQVVDLSLQGDQDAWSVFHIQGEGERSRFPIGDAKDGLGFAPKVRF